MWSRASTTRPGTLAADRTGPNFKQSGRRRNDFDVTLTRDSDGKSLYEDSTSALPAAPARPSTTRVKQLVRRP